jgi:hypothetical protein
MWFRKTPPVAETLAWTLFVTSTASFFVFLAADLMRPGFVSRYLSVHGFLLVAVLSGIWWAKIGASVRDRFLLQFGVAGLFGVALAKAAWDLREGLGEYVILTLLLAFVVPFLCLFALRAPSS